MVIWLLYKNFNYTCLLLLSLDVASHSSNDSKLAFMFNFIDIHWLYKVKSNHHDIFKDGDMLWLVQW